MNSCNNQHHRVCSFINIFLPVHLFCNLHLFYILHLLFCLCARFLCGFPSVSWSSCLDLSVALFPVFDKQPMRWHEEAFRHAEMCQSRPCLSDYSFIWSFALTLRTYIYQFVCISLPLSLPHLISSPLLSLFCTKFLFTSHSFISKHSHSPGLQWQVWHLGHARHRRWMW